VVDGAGFILTIAAALNRSIPLASNLSLLKITQGSTHTPPASNKSCCKANVGRN
jgi:hypothetical protein